MDIWITLRVTYIPTKSATATADSTPLRHLCIVPNAIFNNNGKIIIFI